ncbi:hypothetical protein [Qipengyuania flava]|uniref:hypothetical protein n=1 Tax=Qipengyuania flava TaxID=192812 RepID=UPI001C62F7FD|nr:hypothetical protein [Qipengyuania flava]QYJ06225.1 hypothetical protein KUV82_09020 [Qipengyuania flava]
MSYTRAALGAIGWSFFFSLLLISRVGLLGTGSWELPVEFADIPGTIAELILAWALSSVLIGSMLLIFSVLPAAILSLAFERAQSKWIWLACGVLAAQPAAKLFDFTDSEGPGLSAASYLAIVAYFALGNLAAWYFASSQQEAGA